MYFYTVVFHAIRSSNMIAIERRETSENFENSKYAFGKFFEKYTDQEWAPGGPADRFDFLHQQRDGIDSPHRRQDRDPKGRQDRARLLPGAVPDDDNQEFYQDAYEIAYEKIIDTYAAATQHVDQGLSLTLFFKDTTTTRDINKAQIYAWRKGIKSLYYIRLRQMALDGTWEVEVCVSCAL